MLTTTLIIIAIGANIATLGVVYLLYKKSTHAENSLNSNLEFLRNTEKQIELLQNRFKESLENIISKDSLMIENTTNNIIKYYQDTVSTLTQNYNQNSQKLTEVLNEELKKRVEELVTVVSTQAEESKKVFNAEMQKDLVLIKRDLETYKKTKFKEIDTKVYQIISETAKNTVGKVINMVDHQDLVMRALDQAKKDKFFN